MPKVSPRHSSLKDYYKQVTTDLSLPLPIDGAEYVTTHQAFGQISPPTPFEGLEQINWVCDQRNLDRIGENFPNNDIRPSTTWTAQPPIFTRD